MGRLLPLFPLQLVVFPGSAVPLHIFERRYREMVGEAEAAGTEFGIVLALSDDAIGSAGGISNAGCTVVVDSVVERYPDGRFDVITRGQRRFRILALNEEKDYLQGEVEFFGDDDDAPASNEDRQQALEAFASLRADRDAPDSRSPVLSFELSDAIDDLDFRTMIQQSRSETERLRLFTRFAAKWAARKEYASKMRGLAPSNGHGHKAPGNAE